MKKIAILTSGGDSPGMNAAIVALTNIAIKDKCEVYYVERGFKGLHEGVIKSFRDYDFQQYANLGGSFIGSSRFPEFKEKKIYKKAAMNLLKHNIKKLVVVGGDGSYNGAFRFGEFGIVSAGLPGTIDNDVISSQYSIGFDTALNTAVDSIRKIQDTTRSHNMCIIVEVMGRRYSDLAIYAGFATNATLILTHEYKLSFEEITKRINQAQVKGDKGIIIVVSEFTYDINKLAQEIVKKTKITTRICVLGHVQRGGRPTGMEVFRATRMAWLAYNELKIREQPFCVGWRNNQPEAIDLETALKMVRQDNNAWVKEYNRLKI